MKVKALSRAESSITRECIGDLHVTHRNLNPTAHPLHKAREYTRAVQATKLDRMFAKPFLGSLEQGHQDGINTSCTSRTNLVQFVSGSVDGMIKVWDLAGRKCVSTYERAHSGLVTGVCMVENEDESEGSCLSCGDDGVIRQWKLVPDDCNAGGDDKHTAGLMNTWRHPSKHGGSFKSLDVKWSSKDASEAQFATASDSSVDVWSPSRSSPIQSYDTSHLWGGGDTVSTVRYNPAEHRLLAHCSLDRGIGLHDTRMGSALQKTVLQMRSNCLEWNPMEPMNFVVGNEDHNCYSFDMRRLDTPSRIHKGHVGAVLSVSWSPTGREFCSGSWDKTIRIFNFRKGTSREMYHTKRMQRVFTVNYTKDHQYILSGSADTNIRLWKARASDKVGTQLLPREERSIEYRQTLMKKYSHMPEMETISRSGRRRGPKFIKKQRAIAQIQKESTERKQENRIKHSKPGSVEVVAERDKAVIKTID